MWELTSAKRLCKHFVRDKNCVWSLIFRFETRSGVSGSQVLVLGGGIPESFWLLVSGFRVSGVRFRVPGFGKVQDSGSRVQEKRQGSTPDPSRSNLKS